jgi:hypothetical protein
MNRDFEVVGIPRAGAGVRIYMGLDDMQTATAQPGDVSFFFVKVKDDQEWLRWRRSSRNASRLQGHGARVPERRDEDNALGLKEFIRALSFFASLISGLVILLAMYTTIIERRARSGSRKLSARARLHPQSGDGESFLICVMGGAGYLLSVLGRSALLHCFFPRYCRLDSPLVSHLGYPRNRRGLPARSILAYRAAKLDPVGGAQLE